MIIEQVGIPEIWVDGFGSYELRNGIMRCLGYSEMRDGTRYATVRMIYSLEAALAAHYQAKAVICLPEARGRN